LTEHVSSIGRWISILYRYRQNFLNKRLEPYRIGSGQHLFLLVLERNNGISQEELSDHVKIDKATTAKALKKLEEAGFVERVVDKADKRAYQVFLTPKAEGVIPVIKAAVREWETLVTGDLPESETVMAGAILAKMAGNACHLKLGRKGEL
jgi:DNA-binding MarR family transcriptional regulator